ncbi:RNA-directed DNA polymerase (reverse transcriptase)-related family protein [Rhynchospora pubera]|uniref:RNA-directed DNA polymerase (Reverse transcriptase)-related family protein n=1 Tax=Rhynchospora pubera TaxID=906938 RepID=A0AAV8FJ38_9POAL|nr:RNA-directed DNA polymerase (reverse transcriptase)-related family protein [Rhynchospora pubera]
MKDFGEVSGLMINPIKSKLWFSNKCNGQTKQMVRSRFRSGAAGSDETYLGAFLATKNCAKKTGNMLLEKLRAKLTGWRSNMLSHAGRLVLIKSVLLSVPVYFMSVEIIPKGIIKQIESLIAKFFWGKTDQSRYMSFVSWKRICQTMEKGGLGVRSLQTFGDALFLKLVWDMMSDAVKIWVQVCKGKYYANMGFWRAKNTSGVSPLWRQVVKMRDHFKENVEWQIADGNKITAMSQPWYQGWQVATHASRNDRKITVAQLFDFDTGNWKEEEIISLMGEEAYQLITNTAQKPVNLPGLKDSLIWKYSMDGRYTVKTGYESLRNTMAPQPMEVTWKHIWKWKNIIPKVRVFMWRLLANGLPLAINMHHRIQSISPMCSRCGQENEYATHCFFHCPGSRLVWFGGNLGIRTDCLPLNIDEAINSISLGMHEEGIREVCYTLWEIWLARNELFFQQRNFDPGRVCRRVQRWVNESISVDRDVLPIQIEDSDNPYEYNSHSWQLIIDGSWDTSQNSGSAFLAYHEGVLVTIDFEKGNTADSFQAESVALQRAFDWAQVMSQEHGNERVHIFSDCISLVTALQEGNIDTIPSWRARPILAAIIRQLEQLGDRITLTHVRREAVLPAHRLANLARRNRIGYNGVPTAAVMQEHNIGMNIERRFFQQVQDGPP